MARKSRVDDVLPLDSMIPLGIQHVLAMYTGTVAVALILGSALKLSLADTAALVAADLFMCGFATLLQGFGIGSILGIRLPLIMGITFAAASPMVAIGLKVGGGPKALPYIFGSVICAGVFAMLAAPMMGKFVKLFPNVVTGSVVTIIGLTLIPVGINNARGFPGPEEQVNHPHSLLLAGVVILTVLFCNHFFKGFMQAISILVGIAVGYLVAIPMGMVHFGVIADAGWIGFVPPFHFGFPKFEITSIITMCIIILISMTEATGVFLGVGEIVGRHTRSQDVARGVAAIGASTILGGIFNSFVVTTFSQNVGLVALTKIYSRFVTITAGAILVVLGLFPKFAAMAVSIPQPVIGGAMIVMFAMVAVAGIRMLSKVDFQDSNNLMIVACAIGLGLGVSVTPDLFSKMPQLFRHIIGSSGIVTGTIVAVGLNLLLNLGKREKVYVSEEESA